jgi:WD40 repeat protein
MKTKLIALLLFVLFHQGNSQQLVIDNQGHSGLVHGLSFLNGGNQLLSVSSDKTVRIWDVAAGSLKKTYRFEQEEGANGKIYAAALSSNERFLFLGGFFGNAGDNGLEIGEIRILDLQEEKLLTSLKAHENIVTDLVCSPDGEWLISSAADKTIRIWKISGLIQGIKPEVVAVIDGIENQINTITINPSSNLIAAGDEKGYVRTWDMNGTASPSKMLVHSDEVRAVQFNQDGSFLYSAGDDGQIIKWTGAGKFTGIMAELPGRINVLSLSSNGENLIAMGRVGVVYDLNSDIAISQFNYHTNAVSAITSAPFGSFDGISGNYLASSGGNDKNILIWDANSGNLVRNLAGQGRSVFGVGINEDKGTIALGQSNPNGTLDDIELEKSFNLIDLLLGQEIENPSDFHRNTKANGAQFITKESANTISYGGNTLSTNEEMDGTIRCFSFVTDGQAVVIGSTFSLNKYTTSGELLGVFRGHLGEIWTVAEYEREGLLITGSSDQTIKIWNNITGENLVNLFIAADNEWVIWTPQGFYEASAGGEKYIGWHINKGRKNLAEFHDVSAFRDYYHRRDVIENILTSKSFNAVATTLNVTAKPEKELVPPTIEWVTPYSANSTVNGNSTIVKFNITSETPVTKFKLLADGRPLVTESDLSVSGDGKPEEIEVTLSVPEGTNNSYMFSLFVEDSDSKVTSSERSIAFSNSSETTPSTTSIAEPVTKTPSTGEASRSRLALDPVEEKNYTPGNLYMVSIGISKFENPNYNLNFAEADANSMAELFQNQEGKMFKSVKTMKLVNEDATREKILNIFQKLEEYSTVDDLVVIFMASHGMNVDNQFYIVPHDGNSDNPRYSCIDWRDFSDMIGNMSAKVVLFIDTCHSGQLGNNIGQEAQSNTEAVRELSGKEYGVVIMAAATGYEYSLEHPDWGHGAFTLALLEGINEGKADVKGDGTIYLRELDYYLSERVRELTGGRQHPTTQKPSSISRLSIAKIK